MTCPISSVRFIEFELHMSSWWIISSTQQLTIIEERTSMTEIIRFCGYWWLWTRQTSSRMYCARSMRSSRLFSLFTDLTFINSPMMSFNDPKCSLKTLAASLSAFVAAFSAFCRQKYISSLIEVIPVSATPKETLKFVWRFSMRLMSSDEHSFFWKWIKYLFGYLISLTHTNIHTHKYFPDCFLNQRIILKIFHNFFIINLNLAKN